MRWRYERVFIAAAARLEAALMVQLKRQHNTGGSHCEFCGSSSYGFCSNGPSKKYRPGPRRGFVEAVALVPAQIVRQESMSIE